MIKISQTPRVFFIPIAFADKKYEAWLKYSYLKKRAPAGVASISIAELELGAVEIRRNSQNALWDWYDWLKDE